jgi:hypothetical protein
MDTSNTIALIALFIAGATLIVYLGQLFVLILVYLRVIKATDDNAKEQRAAIAQETKERREAISKAADDAMKTGKYIEDRLQRVSRTNTIGMAIIAALAAFLMLGATRRKDTRQ